MDYLHLKKVYTYTLVSKKTIMDIVAVSFVGILVYFDLLQAYDIAPFAIFFRGGFGDTDGGCIDSDSDSDSDSDTCGFCDHGDTIVTSTPYLYIKKRGHYEMQNDVMIGTPSSYVQSKEEGELRIQSGMMGKDIYPFALAGADIGSENKVQLRIKEIEPEESYIYKICAHCYRVEKNSQLLQSWNHQKLYAVDTSKKIYPKKILLNGRVDCTNKLNQKKYQTHSEEKLHSLRLEKGDVLEFEINKKQGTYLLISSFWRDWVAEAVAESIHGLTSVKNTSLFKRIKRSVLMLSVKSAVFATIVFGLFVGGAVVSDQQNTEPDKDLLAFIKKANQASTAYADTPHSSGDDTSESLVLSYKHPNHGLWVYTGTIQPRAYMPTDIVVEVPEEAFRKNGTAELKIEATKRHYVKGIAVASGKIEKITPELTTDLEMIHKRKGKVVDKYNGGETKTPVHLIAGDTLELQTYERVDKFTHMALEIEGFYMPLTDEGKELVGSSWQEGLDAKEKELMTSLYNK